MLKVLCSDFKIKVTQALDLDLAVKSHISKWGECLKGTQDPPHDTELFVTGLKSSSASLLFFLFVLMFNYHLIAVMGSTL